jgi:hypothetical protein
MTPELAAQIQARIRAALAAPAPRPRRGRHRRDRFERAADLLGELADNFTGDERDVISRALHVLLSRSDTA